MVTNDGHLELTDEGHDIWMKENNPEGWDNRTWAGYVERIAKDPRFKKRVEERKGKLPRCNPFADGWVSSKNFDPIAGLTKSLRQARGE
jgi:hypothetical protein